MAQAKFPTTLEEVNTYYGIVVPYLDTHQSRLNVSTENNDTLQELHSEPASGNGWLQVFPLTQNEATVTNPLRNQRNALRIDITTLLREIYQDIPESALNEVDRSTLKIAKRDTKPTARGPITTAPDVAFTPLEGGNIRQRLRVDEDANRASRHPLADGWERVSKIGGTPPADATECPVTNTGTEALSTFNAGQENDGKRLYSFLRWINLNNPTNNSPWSPMEVVTISAGTVETE